MLSKPQPTTRPVSDPELGEKYPPPPPHSFNGYPEPTPAPPQIADHVAEVYSPGLDAPPEQVRAYLAALMRNRGVAAARANELSQRWTMGTGAELRTYPVAMWRDMFGADGWMLYKDVRAGFYHERGLLNKAGGGRTVCYRVCFAILLLITLGILAAGITLVIFGDLDDAIAIVGYVLIAIGTIGSVAWAFKAVSSLKRKGPKVQKDAEKELRDQWGRTTTVVMQ